MPGLKLEIAQRAPFTGPEEEAILNLWRTSDRLRRAFERKVRAWGVTSTQYNVLRILRGAQPEGLTCAAIGERMIADDPDITRLLARMKRLKLIRQRRDERDRRAVRTHISPAGLELLQALDPLVKQLPGELLGHMSAAELAELIRLLEMARKHSEEAPGRRPECEGQES
jgi:DNA-binding MarR family transcriptional regulator